MPCCQVLNQSKGVSTESSRIHQITEEVLEQIYNITLKGVSYTSTLKDESGRMKVSVLNKQLNF